MSRALILVAVILSACGVAPPPSGSITTTPPTSSPTSSEAATPSQTLLLPTVAPTPVPATPIPGFVLPQDATLDAALARCPKPDEIAFVDSVVPLTFEFDGTAPALVCTENGGSANLTHLQERAYQAVLSMRRITSDVPPPWTELSLFEWFSGEVNGIIFRAAPNSYCCDQPGVLVIKSDQDLSALGSNRWIDRNEPMAWGMIYLVQLLMHEARHVAGFPHTCLDASGNDATLEEGGAWAVVYWFYTWLPQNAYMTPMDAPADLYVVRHRQLADETLNTRIGCPDS
jgi:hypothetical protein